MSELNSSQFIIAEINKFFAVLAKIHAVTYILVIGSLTAALYTYIADPQIHKIWLKKIGYAGVFTLIAYYPITRCFYEKYELGRKYLPTTNSGWVVKDTYFLTKINSNITRSKKFLGYIYVVIKIAHASFIGFLLFLIALLWVKKALGFVAW
ncbi:hypothetical protein [Methylotenera mobilis]|uniref:Uncharacterized protein n=1 Tax=Methylotenera mobilis (strain JLW8 / ATCC BAA-1282 / DSM 17540) TaxID=583345 RepID=C6WWJ0_METML|nr:hypothetical protein [Methylotenera mobilis]ACT48289.1 hypothetical protein Mmol_1383 [Methylotenera mobilis JLW8]